MDIKYFSSLYVTRLLTQDDVEIVYQLCKENKLYYTYCPPFVTKEAIREEMQSLPKGKTMKDKYYLGYFSKDQLIAVMDLIDRYPDEKSVFIGFFMTHVNVQNKGIASQIIQDLVNYLTKEGYHRIQLAWINGNPQAEHFWLKNQWIPIKETISNTQHSVLLAQRILN